MTPSDAGYNRAFKWSVIAEVARHGSSCGFVHGGSAILLGMSNESSGKLSTTSKRVDVLLFRVASSIELCCPESSDSGVNMTHGDADPCVNWLEMVLNPLCDFFIYFSCVARIRKYPSWSPDGWTYLWRR